MSLDNPDEGIIRSVESAVNWFRESMIFNTRVKIIPAQPEKSEWMKKNTLP